MLTLPTPSADQRAPLRWASLFVAVALAGAACGSVEQQSEPEQVVPLLDIGVTQDAGVSDAVVTRDTADDTAVVDTGGVDGTPPDDADIDPIVPPDAAADADADPDTERPCQAGEVCDDGDPCTFDDTCVDGRCTGTPLDCSALDEGCIAGTCVDGACVAGDAPEATPCDDGDSCTDADRCFAGECIGLLRECDEGDGICTASACDRTVGACVTRALSDGVPCSDANSCTVDDRCASGVCVGDAVEDGGRCDDFDACTVENRCESGACVCEPAIACDTLDGPCVAGSCVVGWDALECVALPVVDGIACGSDPSDVCYRGECATCVADAADPADDTPRGARSALDDGAVFSLCAGDVDHIAVASSEARAVGLGVAVEGGCDGRLTLAWQNELGDQERSQTSNRDGCPVAMVEGNAVVRASVEDGIVPSYTLRRDTFLAEREPNDARPEARRIDALDGWRWSGRIDAPLDEDWFAVELAEARRVFVATGDVLCDVDTVLTVFESDGVTPVVSVDDSAPLGLCSSWEGILPAGRFYIQIRAFNETDVGRYTVVFRSSVAPPLDDEVEPNDTRASANGPYAAPIRIRATLSPGDVDTFTWQRPTPTPLRVYTDDGLGWCAVDTVLELLGPDGTSLATNDDAPGRGGCSEVSVVVPAGATEVRVRGYFATTEGPYTVHVTTE